MAEKKSDKVQNFEKALERLETIVGEMESGTLSLEKMMACFEEGSAARSLTRWRRRSKSLRRRARTSWPSRLSLLTNCNFHERHPT